MKASVFLSILIASALASAEETDQTIDLLSIDQWSGTGDWAFAAVVQGSSTEKKWESIEEGSGIFYNGTEGKTSNVKSKMPHGDVELYAEFMIPKSSNSGLYFMERYEVQILDSFGKPDKDLEHGDCAGIYERWDDSKEKKEERGFEGTPPSTNATTAPGTWQTYRVRFRAPRFDAEGKKTENARFILVEHNGTVVHKNVEATGPTRGGVEGEVSEAPLKIQGDHGPVAFRKLTITPKSFD
ncbi:MAG: DUF1080 domain-containing protein [Verrucomicrobiota bacterium]